MQSAVGGYSGEVFEAEYEGRPAILRLYARRPDRAVVDASVLRLVHGLIPVPQVYDAQFADPDRPEPGWLLLERLPGVTLQTRLDEPASRAQIERAYRNAVTILCALARIPMLRPGSFTGPDLRIEPFGAGELPEFYAMHRHAIGLSDAADVALQRVLEDAADVIADLDDRLGRQCLVHSDFNPKNLLVDEQTARICGVLDWEYAHAGSPVTDLGNLLRDVSDPSLVRLVMTEFSANAPADLAQLDPADVLAAARAMDLYALIDLASRRGREPGPGRRAYALVRATAEYGIGARRPGW